jgi:hypothetical protein
MKKIKKGDGQTKKTSYPCMKMKISEGGTEKKTIKKNIMSLCKNEKNQKGGWTGKNPSYPCMKMKIPKRGTEKEKKEKKNLCPNIINSLMPLRCS